MDRLDPRVRGFTRLLEDGAARILECEDAAVFLTWLRGAIGSYGVLLPGMDVDERLVRGAATELGRAIWNATPLPGNGMRPRPLPVPERNSPCPCGSGAKYKRCCGGAASASLAPIDPELMLRLVLDHLPADRLVELAAAGRVAVEPLVEAAITMADAGKPKRSIAVLEPLFARDVEKPAHAHGFALHMLCDLYGDLRFGRKKRALIERLAGAARGSTLRSIARQRLAAILMDDGDAQGAWRAFAGARADDPDAEGLGVLEVRLLAAEERIDEARERARWWQRHLRQRGGSAGEIEMLERLAQDPHASIETDSDAEDLQVLGDWLAEVAERNLPAYRLVEDVGGDLAERLRQMGIAAEEIAPALRKLRRQMKSAPPIDDPPGETSAQDPERRIQAPVALRRTERAWRGVFPDEKPFGTAVAMPRGSLAWEAEHFAEWNGFLEEHPEAFDSLDVLDDLARALFGRSDGSALHVAVIERAAAIVQRAVDAAPLAELHWGCTPNRPALRALASCAHLREQRGDLDGARHLAALVLRLNPNDNQGMRCILVNLLLRCGDDAGALEVANRYPDDVFMDTVFGCALANFRLGRLQEAAAALRNDAALRTNAGRFLAADAVRKPKFSPSGVTLGGDDEAWLYRQEMRAAWQATPGALAWLQRTIAELRREAGREDVADA